ncbi:helix-turn-helix transcriptional regulator [Thalassotalea ganghwensis]
MLNNVIKQARIDKNLKQEDIAEYVGVTVQTYSKWENGKTEPKASQVYKLSKILNISEKEICQGKLLNQKSDPLLFIKKIDSLMKNVSTTEFLINIYDFIDDEEGFIETMSKLANADSSSNKPVYRESELKELASKLGISLDELRAKISL